MEHDFENSRRGAVIQSTGKTRVTMFLDDDVLEHFRKVATQNGRGYQTEINASLRETIMQGLRKEPFADSSHGGRIMVGMIVDVSFDKYLANTRTSHRQPVFHDFRRRAGAEV